jgi:DNA-binding transcriptional regulator YiaG
MSIEQLQRQHAAAEQEVMRLRAEIEVWRGKLATQCGRTLSIIRTWETLPGPKNYTGGDLQRWLSGPMKQAIDAARNEE